MKKLIAIAFAFGLVGLASASELWWCVNSNPVTADGNSFTWNTATLYANTTGYNFGGTAIGSAVSAEAMDLVGYARTTIDGYTSSAYHFYVELANSSKETVRSYVTLNTPQKGGVSYTDLSASVSDGSVFSPSATPYEGFTTFTSQDVIPEPTSGLLVLLGVMALGLRRKVELV